MIFRGGWDEISRCAERAVVVPHGWTVSQPQNTMDVAAYAAVVTTLLRQVTQQQRCLRIESLPGGINSQPVRAYLQRHPACDRDDDALRLTKLLLSGRQCTNELLKFLHPLHDLDRVAFVNALAKALHGQRHRDQ